MLGEGMRVIRSCGLLRRVKTSLKKLLAYQSVDVVEV